MADRVTVKRLVPAGFEQYVQRGASPGVSINGKMAYVSGTVGIDPATKKIVAGGVEAEFEMVIDHIKTVLREAGGDLTNVVKVEIVLTDMGNLDAIIKVLKKHFKGHEPARKLFQASALPLGGQVEMDAVAVLGDVTELG